MFVLEGNERFKNLYEFGRVCFEFVIEFGIIGGIILLKILFLFSGVIIIKLSMERYIEGSLCCSLFYIDCFFNFIGIGMKIIIEI